MRTLAVTLLVLQAAQAPPPVSDGAGRESYAAVSVDKNGALAIRKADGSIAAVYRRPKQTAFEDARLSPDRGAVGAQAMYPNCCGSYDLALRLVVYENGREHWFKGTDLPIFRWTFVEGGHRIAFAQAPVHFGCGAHYELRDVRTERLIDEANVSDEAPGCPAPKPGDERVQVPAWARSLERAR